MKSRSLRGVDLPHEQGTADRVRPDPSDAGTAPRHR